MKKILLGSVLALVFFTGCATIIDGKTQKINLISDDKKTVSINGQNFSAPGIVTVNRSGEDAIVKIEDCKKDVLLSKKVNSTFFINILSGGAFGSSTDYSTDSMWEYDRKNLDVNCK